MDIELPKNNSLLAQGKRLVRIFSDNGYQAFWVGGSVRDLILGRAIDNLDIATSALPGEVEKLLRKNGIKFKPVGKRFGTILAIIEQKPVEITTFRAESRYSDRRHPDNVKFIDDPKTDAKRRDFTINALYFDPLTGKLTDYFNGLKDLKQGLLRFVGKPADRIDEDALRMLRAARFASVLKFKIEKNSFAAIKIRAKYLQGIAGERIKAELDKMLLDQNRVEGIRILDRIGLLKFLVPELINAKKTFHGSKHYHLEGSVFEHTLLFISQVNSLDAIYTGLFHDLGKTKIEKVMERKGEMVNFFSGHQQVSKEMFDRFAQRLKFSSSSKELIGWLILNHDVRVKFRDMTFSKQLAYLLDPRFKLLAEIWYVDSKSNLRTDEIGGKPQPGLGQVAIDSLKMLKKLETLKPLTDKLANGQTIMNLAKIGPGPEVKALILDVIEQIYHGTVTDEKTLKEYLQKMK
ncbi:MAG: CCA tRNA nucleotidyltransferase [Acidobacteriaceae bacterium]